MADIDTINISPPNLIYKTILIVEDEDALRWALKENLIKEGFNVLDAKNGQEGLDFALKNHPDLIFLDLVLPKMFGLDVLKKIREDDWGKNALVVVLTSLGNGELEKQAEGFSVKDFLQKKDWKLDEVVKWVKHKLEY